MKLNYTPLTKSGMSRLQHKWNKEYRTNFGWLSAEIIKKGISWRAISKVDGDKEPFNFKVIVNKASGNFTNINIWLAYVRYLQKDKYWFRELNNSDQITKFREMTKINDKITDNYFDEIINRTLKI